LIGVLPHGASPFHRYSVTVTATLPRNGHFSTMTLRYRYGGKRVVDFAALEPCPDGIARSHGRRACGIRPTHISSSDRGRGGFRSEANWHSR
jgi:hypothetical protein